MSLQFSNTTTKKGIIQTIERRLFGDGNYGFISGNATRLAGFTAEVNLALDKAFAIIFEADGRWQFDDSNHTDYPILTTDLAEGQRDYPFTTDESGNLILDIYKVLVKGNNADAPYQEIYPVDVQSQAGTEGLSDGRNVTGVPFEYDKTANGIFLDPIPSYDMDDGLKIYINREGSYFSTSDTTKMPGFAGTYHEYVPLVASYNYARDNSLPNLALIERDMLDMERRLRAYYARHAKDERHVLRGRSIRFK